MLQRTGASFRPMLWLVATGVLMQMLDTTIVNTALPAMAASLGESPLRADASHSEGDGAGGGPGVTADEESACSP